MAGPWEKYASAPAIPASAKPAPPGGYLTQLSPEEEVEFQKSMSSSGLGAAGSSSAPMPVGPWAKYATASAPAKEPSFLMAPIGGAEMLLKNITGGLAAIPAGVAYGGAAVGRALGADVNPNDVRRAVQDFGTYQPVSDSAKAGEQKLAELAAPVVQRVAPTLDAGAAAVGKVSPIAETMLREAPNALQATLGVVPTVAAARSAMNAPFRPLAPELPKPAAAAPTAEDVVSRINSQQSMGAAAAAPRLTNASQELKDAITAAAGKTGGGVNPEVLARHVDADTLPVRIRLTRGQAKQDPMVISREMNERGKNPEAVKRYNDQNEQLAQNVQAIRDEVGPEVFTTNPVEHADTIIAAYKSKDKDAQKIINSKYKELRDASGGDFPVDAPALLNTASMALHQRLLFDHAPPAIMRTLARLAESNSMTFENFESLRTNLARIMRSPSADGNEKAAAQVIRSAMENLPLQPQAAGLKPIADQARGLARAQFQALEADPAYAAAVNDTVAPDRFINRYVINAPRDDVVAMTRTLSDDERALQTIGVATLDHLRGAAKLDPDYRGNFAAAGYNKALQGLQPKLFALVPTMTAEQLEQLGRVAGYTTFQPKGSFVNNSNTFVAAAADYGGDALEGMGNFAAGGVPVGTWTRRAVKAATSRKEAKRSLAVGAGLDELAEPPKKP